MIFGGGYFHGCFAKRVIQDLTGWFERSALEASSSVELSQDELAKQSFPKEGEPSLKNEGRAISSSTGPSRYAASERRINVVLVDDGIEVTGCVGLSRTVLGLVAVATPAMIMGRLLGVIGSVSEITAHSHGGVVEQGTVTFLDLIHFEKPVDVEVSISILLKLSIFGLLTTMMSGLQASGGPQPVMAPSIGSMDRVMTGGVGPESRLGELEEIADLGQLELRVFMREISPLWASRRPFLELLLDEVEPVRGPAPCNCRSCS